MLNPTEKNEVFLKKGLKTYIKSFSLKKENLQKKEKTIHMLSLKNSQQKTEKLGSRFELKLGWWQ